VVGYLAGWVSLADIHGHFFDTLEKVSGNTSQFIETIIIRVGDVGWYDGKVLDKEVARDVLKKITKINSV
jgi:hypothetical protein